MESLLGAGCIASVVRLPFNEDVAPGSTQIAVRLFAKLQAGYLAIDRRPHSFVLTVTRGQLTGLDAAILSIIRGTGSASEEAGDPWVGVVSELRDAYEVDAESEALRALPFDFLADGELRRLMHSEA
jgi:hypothetical protein